MKSLELILCIAIAAWILGKTVYAIPRLYRSSRDEKGAITYGNLSLLVGYRVITVLVVLGVLLFGAVQMNVSDVYLQMFWERIIFSLFVVGFIAFLLLIITFIIAKLNRFQLRAEAFDILDDRSSEN